MLSTSGVAPEWITAGLAAAAAFVGAYRGYRRWGTKRRGKQNDYQELWHTVFGWPAKVDDDGIIIQPARAGLKERTELLERSGHE